MICDVIKHGQPDVIYIPEDESLPAMMRARVYARMLGLSYYFSLSYAKKGEFRSRLPGEARNIR